MNILFLSLIGFDSLSENNIYTDLLRQFKENGHRLFIISPLERRNNKKSYLIHDDNVTILRLKIGNIQKTNIIEKGISTIAIEPIYIFALKKFFKKIKFDLVLYTTPPITFVSAIKYIKKRDNAKTYLLLKDIFPQNAIDIGVIKKTGFKGLLYKYFRHKEKELYRVSDIIGCMSQANVEYILKHNHISVVDKVEICPNCIEVENIELSIQEKYLIRKKYGIPIDKKVFIYGGNLGKPQGIDYMLQCFESQFNNEDIYFLIVGDGTEFSKIDSFLRDSKQINVRLIKKMKSEDYEKIVQSCDVGLIFLDHRFSIPNFPSRILSYMKASIPVFAITDTNTDIGKTILEGKFGWWCESNDINEFKCKIETIVNEDLKKIGRNGNDYLRENFNAKRIADKILKHYNNKE